MNSIMHDGVSFRAVGRGRRRRARRLSGWVAVAAGACLALPAAPAAPPGGPAASEDPEAALEQALEHGNIPAALRAYDRLERPAEARAATLERIAWADLRYCLREGLGWDRLEAARVLAAAGDAAGAEALAAGLAAAHSAHRTRAAQWAGEERLAIAAPRLRAIAADPAAPPFERAQAAVALHRLGAAAPAVQTLRALTQAEDARVRATAVSALGQLLDPASAEALRQRLEDSPEPIALAAAEALLRMGHEDGRERLHRALAAPVPRLQILAGWHLAQSGDAAGAEVVRKLVEQGFARQEGEPELPYSLEFAVYVLSWIDAAAAAPYVDRLLAREDAVEGALLAARRLAEQGEERALAALERIYEGQRGGGSAGSPYRADAVRYAGWLGDRPEVRALARQGLADESPAVRLVAIGVLARLGEEAALAPIRAFLGGADLLHRVRAAEAMLQFGDGPQGPGQPAGPPPEEAAGAAPTDPAAGPKPAQ